MSRRKCLRCGKAHNCRAISNNFRKEEAEDILKEYYGLPPYESQTMLTNHPHFKFLIEQEYGTSLEALEEWTNFKALKLFWQSIEDALKIRTVSNGYED